MTWLETVAAALSLLGYLLVILRRWQGLGVWVLSNGLWLGLALQGRHWAQAAMWAVYAIGAVIGALQWAMRDD